MIRHAQEDGTTERARPTDAATEEALGVILELLRTRTDRDLSRYKRATLLRRIRRRMEAAGHVDFTSYIASFDQNPAELQALAADLLIHVTSFFRDRAAYEALAKHVISKIVREHPSETPLRAWTPGCSTGEEAYSLAILFFEEFAAQKRKLKLQIFASDVSSDTVAFAATASIRRRSPARCLRSGSPVSSPGKSAAIA